MHLSCLPVSIFPELSSGAMSIKQWAESAKKMGLDAIDISINFIRNTSYMYLKNIKEDLKQSEMDIMMATSYPDFTHPDKLQRMRENAYFKRDIAVCSELNVKYVRILAGQAHPGTARKDGIRWAVENFLDCQKTASKFGVQLLYENHSKPGAWEYMDFSYPLDIFFEIYEQIKGSGIRLNYDIGNIVSCSQNPVSVMENIFDNVETIHISDVKTAEEFSPTLIGTGVVPIKEFFTYLKGKKFSGWLSIEEASFTGLDGIKKAVDTVRSIWEKA